jgi:hypothetical protein
MAYPTDIPPFPGLAPKLFTALTDLTSPHVLPTPPLGAALALVTVVGGDVRYRPDGISPTTSIGMFIPQNTSFTLSATMFGVTAFINDGASTSSLTITYYGNSN